MFRFSIEEGSVSTLEELSKFGEFLLHANKVSVKVKMIKIKSPKLQLLKKVSSQNMEKNFLNMTR